MDINIKALTVFGHENFLKVLNAGIEVNEPMLNFAQALYNQGVAFDDAIKTLQRLYPKVQQSIVPGNVYYIHQPTVVVYGNVDGGTIHNGSSSNGGSTGSGSRKASLSRKQKKNPNGDWVFEGDRVFLNSQWHKAVTDCNLSPVEGAIIIQTNNNGVKKKVGYYSKTSLSLNGFNEFHNTKANPILKYGKGPEGYYYVKSSIVSALSFLKIDQEVEETETKTTAEDSSNTSTTEVQVNLEDVSFNF